MMRYSMLLITFLAVLSCGPKTVYDLSDTATVFENVHVIDVRTGDIAKCHVVVDGLVIDSVYSRRKPLLRPGAGHSQDADQKPISVYPAMQDMHMPIFRPGRKNPWLKKPYPVSFKRIHNHQGECGNLRPTRPTKRKSSPV